jgi:hypothetical protein
MGVKLNRDTIVALYCFCRQAERSLDFALGSDEQWRRLREYYDPQKREQLSSIFRVLTRLGADCRNVPARTSVVRVSFLAPFLFLLHRIANVWKSAWSFSLAEISFVFASLTKFASLLSVEKPATHNELIELRMDLSTCEWIIACRTCGLPELRQADHVEHFCQSNYIEHVPATRLRKSREARV